MQQTCEFHPVATCNSVKNLATSGKYQPKIIRPCDLTFETKVVIVYDSPFTKPISDSLSSFIVVTNRSQSLTKLLKQLASSPCIASFDNQLCNKSVDNLQRLQRVMSTIYSIVLYYKA